MAVSSKNIRVIVPSFRNSGDVRGRTGRQRLLAGNIALESDSETEAALTAAQVIRIVVISVLAGLRC